MEIVNSIIHTDKLLRRWNRRIALEVATARLNNRPIRRERLIHLAHLRSKRRSTQQQALDLIVDRLVPEELRVI